MRALFTPRRRHDPELMDAPGLPEAEVADAYRVLRTVNRQFFGGRRPILREMDRFLRENSTSGEITLLDVGSGSGDLTRIAQAYLVSKGCPTRGMAVDRDPTAIRLAHQEGLQATLADALRLPFANQSIDIITCVKFAHHFSGFSLNLLIAEMARVSRRRAIVLDIRRNWLAYAGFVAWSRVFTRNRLVRHDGPLSVLRGFIEPELWDLSRPQSDFSWSVRRYAGFQLALVGTRIHQ